MDVQRNTEIEEMFALKEEKKEEKVKKQKRFYKTSADLCVQIFLDKADGRLGEA